jgi:hypothetical protein
MISAYLRPGEMFRIELGDVMAPSSTCSHAAIVVAPFEQGRTAKNQRFDETIILDDKVDPWLTKKVVEYTNLRKKNLFREGVPLKLIPNQSLWPFSHKSFLDLVKSSTIKLQCPEFFPSTYVFRHVGPSRDWLLRLRSLEEIQKRGRWMQTASMRRYEASGRMQQLEHKYPELVQRGLQCQARLQYQF